MVAQVADNNSNPSIYHAALTHMNLVHFVTLCNTCYYNPPTYA
jgi:hypothetical protein